MLERGLTMSEFFRNAEKPLCRRSVKDWAAELQRLRETLATANPGGKTMILGEMAHVARRLNNLHGRYRSNAQAESRRLPTERKV